MWIFYSNFILQENTAKAKISANIRINQFTAELKSQLKIRVATGSLVVSQFQVTTSPNSCFEEEIEVLKRVKSFLKKEVGTKEMWSGQKGNIQMKKLMSRHHSDVMTPTKYNWGSDITPMSRRGSVNEKHTRGLRKQTKLQLVFDEGLYLRSRHAVEVAT